MKEVNPGPTYFKGDNLTNWI